MNPSLVLEWLCLSSAPALLLLLIGPTVRRYFGAQAAYVAWLLVPLTVFAAVLAHLLPDQAEQAGQLMPTVQAAWSATTDSTRSALSGQTITYLSLIWIAGTLAVLLLFAFQQQRFQKRLGRLTRLGEGVYRAQSAATGPALVGWLAAKIVLPADFEQRYTGEQQELILLHEQTHRRRGDAWVNLLLACWQAFAWFNPIVHLAVARIRRDQELACDACVLSARPGREKAYAEAMLSTQLTVLGLPVGCHWQSSHPLKERLIMLQSIHRNRWQRALGYSLLLGLGLAVAGAGFASQDKAAETEFDTAPSYASISPPKYPKAAIDAGIVGRVLLRLTIGIDGKPANIAVEQATPPDVFDQAAIDAVGKWTFNPALKGGAPVVADIIVPIDFSADPEKLAPMPATTETVLDNIQIRGN